MIKKEFYRENKKGIKLYKTYSDKGFKIKKKGTEEIYDEAVDVESSKNKYEETDILIDIESLDKEGK